MFLGLFFLLAACFLKAVLGTAGWAMVFSLPLSVVFVPRPWVSSSCGFVMNHVFAVVTGMSLC
jgi:hypothetical protein